MTRDEFAENLRSKLIELGVDESVAAERSSSIMKNFSKVTASDASKYYTQSNVDLVAGKIARDLQADPQKPTIVMNSTKNAEVQTTGATKQTPAVKSDAEPTRVTNKNDVVFVNGEEVNSAYNARKITVSEKKESDLSRLPKTVLVAMLILFAPTLLLIAAVILGVTTAVAFAMAGVIIALILAIAAIVCGGSVLSVLAFVYGLSQIISEPRYVGLHEIGLALVLAGITVLVCVLLYNIAVRLIPWLYKLIGAGLHKLFIKIREFVGNVRRGVVNL